MPKGCYIQLEKVVRENILQNIRNAIVNKSSIIQKIINYFNETDGKVSLNKFLNYNNLDARDIYFRGTFLKLCSEANVKTRGYDPKKDRLYSDAFLKLSHIDSRRWILTLKNLLENDVEIINSAQEKMLLMFFYNFNNAMRRNGNYLDVKAFINDVKKDESYCEELIQLLDYKFEKIKFVDEQVDLGFENTLDIHCSYSRDEVLTGLGINTINFRHELREGAYYFKEKDTDVFFINLQKSDKEFSPTTMYEDYIISNELFHWQSQNKTGDKSPVGVRYLNQRKNGGRVLLFVRECKSRDNVAEPYYFLGKANYESHRGSKPISIVWRLEKAIPPHILEKLNTVK